MALRAHTSRDLAARRAVRQRREVVEIDPSQSCATARRVHRRSARIVHHVHCLHRASASPSPRQASGDRWRARSVPTFSARTSYAACRSRRARAGPVASLVTAASVCATMGIRSTRLLRPATAWAARLVLGHRERALRALPSRSTRTVSASAGLSPFMANPAAAPASAFQRGIEGGAADLQCDEIRPRGAGRIARTAASPGSKVRTDKSRGLPAVERRRVVANPVAWRAWNDFAFTPKLDRLVARIGPEVARATARR
jgi:hypothetical protein